MRKSREKGYCRLAVFKGREARLNKAIFRILAQKGPQTIYNIHKEVKTKKGLRYIRYASVNRRVRFLGDSGYIQKIGIKRTKAGFQASVYKLATKAYLALLLNSVNLDELLKQIDESTAEALLSNIMNITESH